MQPTQINADHADRRRYSYVNLSKLAKIILNERLSVSQDSPFENTGVSEFIDLDIFLDRLNLPRLFTEAFRG